MKLSDLKKLEQAATPGPWINKPSGIVQRAGGDGPLIFWDDDGPNKQADYALIAACRTMLPKLLTLAEVVSIPGFDPAQDHKDHKRLRDALKQLESES